jgi:hypothetical protein
VRNLAPGMTTDRVVDSHLRKILLYSLVSSSKF